MRGYLLDTNILSYWFDSSRPEHGAVAGRLAQLPDASPLAVSAITLGEVEFGYRVLGEVSSTKEVSFHRFLEDRVPLILDVKKSTRTHYGSLRARLFEEYAPRDHRKRGLRPEQLLDPATSRELGIQENDLWIAAQALEHNLVLVTHDRIKHIRGVAEELRVEDWALADGSFS